MKFQNEFFEYLIKDFRSTKTSRPYSAKAAHDLISRLRRARRILNIDLDEIASENYDFEMAREKIRKLSVHLGATEKNPYGYNNIVNAIRRYREFIEIKNN